MKKHRRNIIEPHLKTAISNEELQRAVEQVFGALRVEVAPAGEARRKVKAAPMKSEDVTARGPRSNAFRKRFPNPTLEALHKMLKASGTRYTFSLKQSVKPTLSDHLLECRAKNLKPIKLRASK